MIDLNRLDDIDFDLLECVEQNPGKPLSSAMQTLSERRCRRTLYNRLFALETQQFISVDRFSEKGAALATITPKGKAVIKGRMDSAPSEGVKSL
jgi:hypothetical protein